MKTVIFKKITPIFTVLLCAVLSRAAAQDADSGKKKLSQSVLALVDAKPSDSPGKIVGDFFALLSRNQIDQAYDQLASGTVIASNAKQMTELKTKTRDAVNIFGAIQGQEPVAVKNVGTHLMCATYISLGKEFPLRWKFYFYRADKTWHLIDIRVDDRLTDMFDEKTPAPQAPAASP
jgi:hypothetical protein